MTAVQLHVFLNFATYDSKEMGLSNNVPRKWRAPNIFIIDSAIQEVSYKSN